MKEKLIEQIKFYKAMVRAYEELMDESTFEGSRLNAKKGTMLMVIEDLEKLLGEEAYHE